jgi:hypothetical protein
MIVMAFQSSPIFSLPRARLECGSCDRSVFCVLLIIMDGSDEKRPKPRETGNFGAAETACGVGAGVAPRSLCRLP